MPEPDESVDDSRAIEFVKRVGGGTAGRLIPVKGYFKAEATLQDNKMLLENVIGYDPKFLHYHKGWFQSTLPNEASQLGEIAILRLDSDWYASTKICLDHLYSNVVTGGFVIIDDYGCYAGCRKAVDEFINSRAIKAYLNHLDQHGRYWIKP